MYFADVCTIASNLAGDPSGSIPIGLDGEGLPIGFQIMAPSLHEAQLFRLAAEVERCAGFDARPALATSEVRPA
jgi:aspartyl-tRNA(Asn)/glutamyl-tRNA(Gln) amidotransferase subunit A